MPSQILLSDAQRLEFTSVPESITDDELEYFYSLREDEIQIVNNNHRGDENRLGFAMNLCCLRHKGWPFLALTSVAERVISFVANQIGASPNSIDDYKYNKSNKSTRYYHMAEICSIYGYRQDESWPEIKAFINDCSKRLNDFVGIMKDVMRFAINNKIIPPKITTIERMVREAINTEEERIYKMISGLLSDEQKESLDKLTDLDETRTSGLFDIKEVSGKWNSNAFKEISSKLESVKKIGIPDKLGDIHPNLLKSLAR